MPEKDILGLDKQFLMLWTTENEFIILRNLLYHHQNGVTVGKASKATVIAAVCTPADVVWQLLFAEEQT